MGATIHYYHGTTTTLNTITQSVAIALERSTVVTGLQVALVVGTVLNLINQWEALYTLDWQALDPAQMVMTFCVPYLVSTYATIKAKLNGAGEH